MWYFNLMREQPLWIPHKNTHLAAVLHTPLGSRKYPTIILCHGFMGDKLGLPPWGFVAFARRLAKQNFVVLRFFAQFVGSFVLL